MRRIVPAVASVALVALAACGGSYRPNNPSPLPSAPTSVRSLAACAPSVHVPAALVQVVPAPRVPPTAVLRVGEALGFAATGHVGFTGVSAPGERATLCRVEPSSGTRVTLVARRPGYVRIAVLPANGGAAPLLLIKVTS